MGVVIWIYCLSYEKEIYQERASNDMTKDERFK